MPRDAFPELDELPGRGAPGATDPAAPEAADTPEAPLAGTRGVDPRRTEPGTWREIIARFEHELDEVATAGPDISPDQPPAGPSPVEPLETAVPWEFEGMTTPDYAPPRSIHDPEHDSWPVEAEDGNAMPAWSDDVGSDGEGAEDDEIGEMVLDQIVKPDPWDVAPGTGDASSHERAFPLNAFIVPAGVEHVPSGYAEGDVAQRVAHRLDELAQELRDGGLGALGRAGSADELSRVLAAIVTGYVSRGS